MNLSVVLVEDHLAYRESLRIVLTHAGGFEVVGQAGGAHDGCNVIERCRPDLAVIDFMLPDGNGISVVRELKRRGVNSHTLILGRVNHPDVVRDGVLAGVGGFASKSQPLDTVIQAMRRVASGERNVGVAEASGGTGVAAGHVLLRALSRREREILFLLIEGQSSKEIAKSLFLSAKTVDAHRLHINRKLGVRSPAGFTRLMADQGLMS